LAAVQIAGLDTIVAVFDVDYTNVEDPLNGTLFSAYPVPASDQLNVNLQLTAEVRYDIVLYSIQGQEVFRQSFSQQSMQTTIDTRNLARGMYVLSLESELGFRQKKIPLVE
jgi:hypothetical protein